jgi:putative FmdB family regulatory protein
VPTYEYTCTTCGHRLEAVQSFSDDPLSECPECGGALRKVYGAVGIVLKGSGFYKTDSRAASAKSNGRTSDGDSSKSGDSTSGESSSSSNDTSKSGDSSKSSDSSKGGDTSSKSGDSSSGSKESKPAASAARSS